MNKPLNKSICDDSASCRIIVAIDLICQRAPLSIPIIKLIKLLFLRFRKTSHNCVISLSLKALLVEK